MRNMVIVVIIVITGERMSSPTLLTIPYQKILKIIGVVKSMYFPKSYELASVVLRQSAL